MKTLKPLPLLLSMLAGGALAYEEPNYETLGKTDVYEVRRYEPYLVAETTVAGGFDETGNTAFRRLAGYIFGDNRNPNGDGPGRGESVRMNMTVPVTRQSAGAGSTVYRFVMERAYDLDSLPVPNAGNVVLERVPGGPVAVLRYRGRITEARFRTKLEVLRAALCRDGLEPDGEPMSAIYNAPFTPPFLRRNEVMVPLASYPSQTATKPTSAPHRPATAETGPASDIASTAPANEKR